MSTYLKLRPRLGYYANAKKTLTYNPDSGEARSYQWYRIAARVNGVMILNTYRYSPTTSRHASELGCLFDSLGISYQCVEAPDGLPLSVNDPDKPWRAVKEYLLQCYADAVVREKYARKKQDADEFAAYWAKRIEAAQLIGVSLDLTGIAHALQDAEETRRHKLGAKRAKRALFDLCQCGAKSASYSYHAVNCDGKHQHDAILKQAEGN